jgi:N-acetylmuramoyl-L-alanine amidase
MISRSGRRAAARLAAAALLALVAAPPIFPQGQPVVSLAVENLDDGARLILSSTRPLPFLITRSGNALLVELQISTPVRFQRAPVTNPFVRSVDWSRAPNAYTLKVEAAGPFVSTHQVIERPFQLVIDLKRSGAEAPATAPAATPPAKPEITLPAPEKPAAKVEPAAPPVVPAGAKKIRTVVIDPGHGGIETGAKGVFGAQEKDVTLAISLKLKDVLEKSLAFRVVLTRDRDTEIALESRAAVANNNKADVFISLHTNGSRRKLAQGSETFFLNLNATDEEARRLAYMENTGGELAGQIAGENQDDVELILWDMAQAAFLTQSSQLAEAIQAELNALLGTLNRGLKQAPFKVLTGVACPAVLVEVAFISNPEEEKKLLSPGFQDNVVQAVHRGLLRFFELKPS